MNISKFTTIESILDKTGDVNSAIVKQHEFKNSKIYQDVFLKTKCLDIFNGVTFSQRVMFIQHNMKIEKCPTCGKEYIKFPKSQKTYSFCSHKKNITFDLSKCKKKQINNKKLKFIKSLNDKNLFLKNSQFNEMLNEINQKKDNFANVISEHYFNFFHDCIIKTENFIKLNQKKLNLQERIYCLTHKIYKSPLCKYCEKEHTQFINKKVGYSTSCKKCSKLKNIETRQQNLKTLLLEKIDQSKYEIIHFPQLLNFDSLQIKCNKCGKISNWEINNGKINDEFIFSNMCKHCERVISKGEEELYSYIKEIYNGIVIHKKDGRKIIPPKELDIYVPDMKLAFEYNGDYWHSVKNECDDALCIRHVNKTNQCESKNIQLIQIFESQWINKKDLIKSKIRNLFGLYDKTIFARKCIVKNIPNDIAKTFLNENHLQGNANSKVKLGLFYNEELIAVMTFNKPRFNRQYDWELIRYCSKTGYHIPGGAGKLLKFFERCYNPASLLSYADRCWSVGKLYTTLGFSLSHISKPNYFYVKGNIRLSRLDCQKHKLKNLLSKFDQSKSEFQNMKDNGFVQIFDCGNLVFVKNY